MTKQYQSDTINELVTALAKAQGDFTHAAKGVENEFFKTKYADLAAVMDAARPHLAKNGLSVIQITDTDEQGQLTLITQVTHSTGQFVRSWYPIRPVKIDPQAMGSALTYARRYAYSSLVGVAAAGEDDDGNAASGNDSGSSNRYTQKSAVPVSPERLSVIKAAIETSNDPASTWGEHLAEINAVLATNKPEYDNLVKLGAKRKAELNNAA